MGGYRPSWQPTAGTARSGPQPGATDPSDPAPYLTKLTKPLVCVQQSHHDDQLRLRGLLDKARYTAETLRERAQRLAEIVDDVSDTRGERFGMQIGGASPRARWHTKRIDAGAHLRDVLLERLAATPPETTTDPHKASHSAAVLDGDEELVGELRIEAGPSQRDRLLEFAVPFQPRTCAVEAASGWGALLAQQLIAVGESVVDVSPALAARARLLAGGR